jgi:hypothetical protein
VDPQHNVLVLGKLAALGRETRQFSPWINRRLAEGLDLTGSAVAIYTIQINQIAGQALQRQIEAARPSS